VTRGSGNLLGGRIQPSPKVGRDRFAALQPIVPGDLGVPGVPYYHRVLPIWDEAGHYTVKLIGSVPVLSLC
jgi:hypothetical protein